MNRLLGRRGFGAGLTAGAATALACGCGQALAQHQPPPASDRLLDAGAALLQAKAPLNAMNLYLDGFHFYADDMGRVVEAHHYCTHLT